jgi:hypothetical protein
MMMVMGAAGVRSGFVNLLVFGGFLVTGFGLWGFGFML